MPGRHFDNPPRTADLTGQRFGRLVVLHRDDTGHGTAWRCRCDCSGNVRVPVLRLTGGEVTECHDCRVADPNPERATYRKLAAANPGTFVLMRVGEGRGISFVAYDSFRVICRIEPGALDTFSEMLMAAGTDLFIADACDAQPTAEPPLQLPHRGDRKFSLGRIDGR